MEERLEQINNLDVIGEEFFKKFEEVIEDDQNGKQMQDLIEENKNLLNGRFGRKQETPLHRYNITKEDVNRFYGVLQSYSTL